MGAAWAAPVIVAASAAPAAASSGGASDVDDAPSALMFAALSGDSGGSHTFWFEVTVASVGGSKSAPLTGLTVSLYFPAGALSDAPSFETVASDWDLMHSQATSAVVLHWPGELSALHPATELCEAAIALARDSLDGEVLVIAQGTSAGREVRISETIRINRG